MSATKSRTMVFYDGHCGLCHGLVRFLLARDPGGTHFAFAPLQGYFFATAIPEAERAGLPDSVVVKAEDGRLLVRSGAMIYLLRRLGRSYRFMAAAMEVLPPGLLDRCYDAIARRRRKLFAKPLDVCPAIPPHWRSRFYL